MNGYECFVIAYVLFWAVIFFYLFLLLRTAGNLRREVENLRRYALINSLSEPTGRRQDE